MGDRFFLTPYFLDQPAGGFDDLARDGWVVNRPMLPAGDTQTRLLALYEPLSEAIAGAAAAGRRPVSMAGDCCTALAMLAGLERAGIEPSLLWFDAHGDFNTPETTPSGFLGGMPLAMLAGRGDMKMIDGLGIRILPESKIYLAGARDLDHLEALAISSSKLNQLPQVTDLTGSLLPWGPLWVHFDIDVVDPSEAPAVYYPAAGGPSARIMGEVFGALAVSRQVSAVSFTLWTSDLDTDGRTREVALKLLAALLGPGATI